ncbi:hypothetical protein GCM10023193_05810 [Planotetraspora kaengkrachanensis]|uniref:Uncharacterized protein n=1 Tax=Planotetraspora kaengkrachanensis TaxID=575193 RepID=A0A8J3Q1S5_9ACTN|nr:hypothetical protein Pka01_80790 [Planotetraspora kaengkrachanensis]
MGGCAQASRAGAPARGVAADLRQQFLDVLRHIPRVHVFRHGDDAKVAEAVVAELLTVTVQTNPVVPAGRVFVVDMAKIDPPAGSPDPSGNREGGISSTSTRSARVVRLPPAQQGAKYRLYQAV